MTSYLAGSFGAVPKVSEGQVGRRLLRADESARTEAGRRAAPAGSARSTYSPMKKGLAAEMLSGDLSHRTL